MTLRTAFVSLLLGHKNSSPLACPMFISLCCFFFLAFAVLLLPSSLAVHFLPILGWQRLFIILHSPPIFSFCVLFSWKCETGKLGFHTFSRCSTVQPFLWQAFPVNYNRFFLFFSNLIFSFICFSHLHCGCFSQLSWNSSKLQCLCCSPCLLVC